MSNPAVLHEAVVWVRVERTCIGELLLTDGKLRLGLGTGGLSDTFGGDFWTAGLPNAFGNCS